MRLTLSRATLGYAGHTVLHDAAFSLQAGTLTCLLGANGSGKTTIMRSLLGILPLQGGEILLDGAPLHRLSHRERAKILAWVPQAHEGAFAFRVLDMVMMGLSPHMNALSVPGRREHDAAREQLTVMGIAHLAQRNWMALSGGERQLVLIARALVQRPRLLLMDEPASSLDFGHQIGLLDTLNRLRRNGMTLLMSTHHPLHARAVADSVVRIEPDGRVTQGKPDVQLHPEALAALYRVTPEQIRRHLGGNTQ